MEVEGPPLEVLLQRIANAPEEFLTEPKHGRKGSIVVPAVAGDLCRLLGVEPTPAWLRELGSLERNAASVALLLCWLLADDVLRAKVPDPNALFVLLRDGARELAPHTASKAFVDDVERREELARFAMKRLALRPSGESEAQAADRLTSLSAAERARVLEASRAAEARAREVREALARKAAEESADKWSRE